MGRAVVIGCLGLVACASGPRGGAESALYSDLQKVISSTERLDWVVDRHGIEESLPDIMPSLCQVPLESRLATLRFLEAQIAAEGGSAEEIWSQNGHDLGAVEHLLKLERMNLVLQAAMNRAPEDCPFWLEPDEDFNGVHGTQGFTLIAESNGGGGLIIRGGDVALGGGGGGRLLGAWGFDEHITLATGIELGAIAAFRENEDFEREVQAQFMGAIPLLLRLREGLNIFDIEAAPVFRYVDSSVRSPGFRVSIGYGLGALRGGGFMPHAVLWVGYEYQPARLNFEAEHSLRAGTRVGVNWDIF